MGHGDGLRNSRHVVLEIEERKIASDNGLVMLEAWRRRRERHFLPDETVDLREINFERLAPHVSPPRHAGGKFKDLTFHRWRPLFLKENERFSAHLRPSCGNSAAGVWRRICQFFIIRMDATHRWDCSLANFCAARVILFNGLLRCSSIPR